MNPWSRELERYLTIRRSLGYALRTDERILRRFIAFADQEGASEPLFEEVMIELMKRGWEPERAQVKALMNELSQPAKPPTLA